jgi:hypothetical protein
MANISAAGPPDASRPYPTARDAATVQRLWRARELSDGDVDRVIGDLRAVVGQHDRAGELLRRLAEVWPRDALRRAEAWIEETDDEVHRVRLAKSRRAGD